MAIINIGYDYTIEEPADLDGKLLRQQGRPEQTLITYRPIFMLIMVP